MPGVPWVGSEGRRFLPLVQTEKRQEVVEVALRAGLFLPGVRVPKRSVIVLARRRSGLSLLILLHRPLVIRVP